MAAVPAPEPAPLGLVERLRAVHLEMVDAVLGGDGLGRVAELAAAAAGAPVAIVIPRLGAAVASPGAPPDLQAVRRYVGDRVPGAAAAASPGRRTAPVP